MPGKRKTALTKLEGEVMRAVWDAEPNPVRVREVMEALNKRRRKPLAYNTVQTMLTILRTKGIVSLAKGGGRAHLYRARVSREAASRHMVSELVDRLFNGRVEPLLQQLIDEADMDPHQLQALRDWVDDKLRDAEEDQE
ncbi:MAG: BlaI/MecI/CopY family transcriptional regulator [Planctomycetes bacterium]|nr:BlaI/MecI/CopY family transcriptional regulator [Planctomycetota bacterium]